MYCMHLLLQVHHLASVISELKVGADSGLGFRSRSSSQEQRADEIITDTSLGLGEYRD